MNQTLLSGLIAKKGISKKHIAETMNIDRTTLYSKLNGDVDFKAKEIKMLYEILDMTPRELLLIFFGIKGGKI